MQTGISDRCVTLVTGMYILDVLGLPTTVKACLFDLDGVLTQTAAVHNAAWRATFDEFLQDRSGKTGEPFVPFDPEADYNKSGRSGVFLTEHYAMFPAAAVSGWYFAHPEAQYFAVGKVDKDQIERYTERKAQDIAVSERWLAPNLGYDD